MKIRTALQWLFFNLEKTLVKNDMKPAWELQSILDCKEKLLEEQAEFFESIREYQDSPDNENLAQNVLNEGFDYILCIFFLLCKHDLEMGKLRRGKKFTYGISGIKRCDVTF